ncbi:UDP-glucuronosyltransferase 2a1-like [Plakobranchus ocellatus]|uniref:UDP-glucuronosyltransferase 2a1-like n=1 Tax=Plakobranchus ocellatus TaxID=259542 RepID=A0AAV3Z2N7_9GAST|nr:UDP-glucuronosyltransferase 2a1-like [Plakobranchus ocellatus]
MYGCEAWTISKQIQNKLEATEMWFLRRMLRIPWTAKKTNERVLNEANKRRSLIRIIRKRQATFLGHVMRRGKLEHLVTTGKFEGKRSRGRQREKIMDGLATWLGPGKVSDIPAAVKDRDLWRDMIANAYKQGTCDDDQKKKNLYMKVLWYIKLETPKDNYQKSRFWVLQY